MMHKWDTVTGVSWK